MANVAVQSPNSPNGLFKTERKDFWWVEPVLTVLALVLFSIYAIWAALQNQNYEWGPYISPFYSPNLRAMFPHAFDWVAFSPAFLVLWAPLGFRATCYFYRRAYYRSFFWDPPACAVGEPTHKEYTGERLFPFVLQNLHRYFLYCAIVLAIFHWTHFVNAMNFNGHFGFGVGTLVIFVDALFLSLYVFSCHSFRHLIGGKLNCFSCSMLSQAQHGIWKCQSKFNENHMVYAWVSLFTVGFADLYVRLLASGVIHDFRFI